MRKNREACGGTRKKEMEGTTGRKEEKSAMTAENNNPRINPRNRYLQETQQTVNIYFLFLKTWSTHPYQHS